MKNNIHSIFLSLLVITLLSLPYTSSAQAQILKGDSIIEAVDSVLYDDAAVSSPDQDFSSDITDDYALVQTSQWVPPADYQTLQIKSKCVYSGPDMSQSFTANIKIEKDKKIWISVVGAGVLEVGRALITPDSAIILNRLESIAFVQNYESIKEFIQLNVDFYTLQAILSNQLPAEMPAQVHNQGEEVHLDYPVSSNINSDFVISKKQEIWKSLLLNFTQGEVQNAALEFGDYTSEYGYPIAMTRQVKINEKRGKHNLLMNISKVVVNEPLSMSIVIPERYTIKSSF